ncbi:MAG: leucine--tRNA ligase [Verrucomicrobiae bacterium]|nr:leucine--tRNA ligase [Verrucomicrobiae bacterium]
MARRPYPFHWIEPKWQGHWEREETFRAWNPGETIPRGHPFGRRHGLEGEAVTARELPPKCYILDMFPYPSGAGLHVGHPEGYTATDILARYRRARGEHVLHPMGWDAFGLPAEQYAIRTGQHPRITTEANITTFRRQIRSLGFSYDWSREVDTTRPEYFRWTQWIFLQLYGAWFNPVTERAEPIGTLPDPPDGFGTGELEARRRAWRDAHRLAYVSEAPVWWCEALGTVLANEEVVDGRSEVGKFPVERRPMRQWMLRITAFAERLLRDLDTIDWSDSLKAMQRNWIGRSEGAEVRFEVEPAGEGGGTEDDAGCLTVFTTRPDTLFGATYMVLAPEHAFLDRWQESGRMPAAWPEGTPESWRGGAATPMEAVREYQKRCARKSDLERTELAREKTGVFTGVFARNPVTGGSIPIWIADYVLATYGTGAIMAVPAHDLRDLEFADAFGLPVVQVVAPPEGVDWRGFVEDGTGVNSSHAEFTLDGVPTAEAKRRISDWLEARGLGWRRVQYKLRDWLFSRQRYWGEPFPIVWRRDGQGNEWHEALPASSLPVLPPALDDYKPTPDGRPPLARAEDWVSMPDGARREVNTMPQWAGSCWYYLRYLDARRADAFVGSEAERYWMGTDGAGSGMATPGVDLYVGGTEHAVLHLLYARFWHKVLFDLGHVSTHEPFHRLVNQGLILGEDGQKMSKSLGNVVNPDDILKEYGADAFRLYEMFLGPLQDTKPWSTQGVEGVYRFLGRVWRVFIEESEDDTDEAAMDGAGRLHSAVRDEEPTPEQWRALHACIRKVTEDLDGLRFNTAISAMMVFVNEATGWAVRPVQVLRPFLQLLAPFAPHLSEELWERVHRQWVGEVPSLSYAPWPAYDAARLVEDIIEIPVQVNGKLRDVIRVAATASGEELEAAAREAEKVRPFIEGRTLRKVIVVPRKMVNLVVG